MQHTSPLYNEIIAGDHWVEVKVEIDGVEYGMDALESMQTTGAVFGDGKPTIGLAVSRTIQIRMLETISSGIPRMAEIRPFVRVCNDTQQSEWLPKGVFYVDSRTIGQNDSLELDGFDAMMMAERYLDMSDIEWPLIDYDVVEMIADDLGVNVSIRTYVLMSMAFDVTISEDITERQILSNIAAMYGGSFVINDEGELELICIWNKPPETNYLTDDDGNRLIVGSDRILLGEGD